MEVLGAIGGDDTSAQNRWHHRYELKNHLGNVMTVITGDKDAIDDTGGNLVDAFRANLLATYDYYPFGAPMKERKYLSSDYRYGFQGQEMDDEIKGNGNSVNYKYRMHDPRLGRFLAMDADSMIRKYPYYSPYAFSGNRVIDKVEIEGLQPGERAFRAGLVLANPNAADLDREMRKKTKLIRPEAKHVQMLLTEGVSQGTEFALQEAGLSFAFAKGVGLTVSFLFISKGAPSGYSVEMFPPLDERLPEFIEPSSQSSPKKQPDTNDSQPIRIKIKKGDTFYDIEKERGLEQGSMEKANPNQDPKKLMPGQQVELPIKNENDS